MTKLVFFHSKLNLPPLGGGDVHSHEILACLKSLGFKIYLFLLETQEKPILTHSHWGYEEVHILREHENRGKVAKAFDQYLNRVNPEVIWVNYSTWGHILDVEKHKHRLKIIYNHHSESVRMQLAAIYYNLWNKNVPDSIEAVEPKLFDLKLFEGYTFETENWEYEAYERYDITFVIEDFGAPLIKQRCRKTKVYSFPVTLSAKECPMEYQKMALYTMSPYSFHFQGYYFFVKCVLPLILKKEPLFRVRLTGIGSEYFLSSPHIICKRYVLNLEEEYQKARLLICPSFSGTGQQVKIVEAMHYGLPVVSMFNPHQFNPLESGKTGYIARNAEEFADSVLKLYQNQNFAREMGQRAKETIRKNYSHQLLFKALKKIKTHLKEKHH